MTFVVSEPCIDVLDRSCVEECPVDCLYAGGRMMYINPSECIDCGACAVVCPQAAIYRSDELGDALARFEQVNEEFARDQNASGGAGRRGDIDADHPVVAGYPRG